MKTIDEIIDLGCRFYETSRESMIGERRDEPIVLYRFSVMHACRKAGFKLVTIGSKFNRDHGTVMNALRGITPEKFKPDLWVEHQRFLSIILSGSNPESPVVSALCDVERVLSKVEADIVVLSRTRDQLLDAKKAIAASMA